MGASAVTSTTLLNAQLGFLDTHIALIHLPLAAFPLLLQPLSQLLLQNRRLDESGEFVQPLRSWAFWHPFVNISITPNECSVACPRDEANALFAPMLASLSPELQKSVSISREDYSVITIGGEGLEAGQRVLDLTSPLAMAGIPIFFITSYWSDFILVPYRARGKVIHALEERGFVFEADDNEGEAGHMTNPASPMLQLNHQRTHSSPSSYDFPPTANTPPPATVPELQERTFKLLKRNNIRPVVNRDIELVTCAGIKDNTASAAESNFTAGKLQLGLIKCLTSSPPPRFLSMTLTNVESVSLTLEKTFLAHFANGGEDILLGKDGPEQIPITLDLRDLPLESTGIVCGVASRLIDGMKGRIGSEMFNMSYLSTARAGHVVVYEDELDDALEFLERVQETNGVSKS